MTRCLGAGDLGLRRSRTSCRFASPNNPPHPPTVTSHRPTSIDQFLNNHLVGSECRSRYFSFTKQLKPVSSRYTLRRTKRNLVNSNLLPVVVICSFCSSLLHLPCHPADRAPHEQQTWHSDMLWGPGFASTFSPVTSPLIESFGLTAAISPRTYHVLQTAADVSLFKPPILNDSTLAS